MFFSSFQIFLIGVFINAVTSSSCGEVCPAVDKKEYSFRPDRKNGPSHWGGYCNTGHMQSPINIITSKLTPPKEAQILKLKNFDKPIGNVKITNYGELVVVNTKDDVERALIYDGHEYPLDNYHFHFGNTSEGRGSEHTIDGKRFPLETHFMFLLPDKTYIQVSSLFEIGDEINPAFDNMLSVESSFRYQGDQFEGEIQRDDPDPRKQGKIYLDDILDLNCPYYHYIGSDTVPPCPEQVPWLVCKTHQHIHYSQLMKLRLLHSVTREEDVNDDCFLFSNCNRPLQGSGNDRVVYG